MYLRAVLDTVCGLWYVNLCDTMTCASHYAWSFKTQMHTVSCQGRRFQCLLGSLWNRWTILNWTHADNELSGNNHTLVLHLKSGMHTHSSEEVPECGYDKCPYRGRAGNTTASLETTSHQWAHQWKINYLYLIPFYFYHKDVTEIGLRIKF